MIYASTCKAGSAEPKALAFPYQEYLDARGEDATIGDDGDGFNAISNNIRYPQLPDKPALSQFADSLLQFYNMSLAFNSIAYDCSTAERYMEEADSVMAQADALDSVNLSGITVPAVKDALLRLSKGLADYIRVGEVINEQSDDVDLFFESYYNYRNPLFEAHLNETVFNPADVVENYAELHSKAISDKTTFRNELLQMVLNEPDFGKKCVLAREFVFSNFVNPNRNDLDVVAVIDPLLQAGEYSPTLDELWLIWRTALQINIFGGPSNDSPMYNLFYNDMRNRVASTFIAYLNTHPEDKLAFNQFVNLTMEYNIIRNSEALLGNNSLIDEWRIFNEVRDK